VKGETDMQLVYRGQTIQCPTQPVSHAVAPRAMNWRYQVSEEVAEPGLVSAPKHYHPQAMNWRFESVVKA
jgi:hypothetical protein